MKKLLPLALAMLLCLTAAACGQTGDSTGEEASDTDIDLVDPLPEDDSGTDTQPAAQDFTGLPLEQCVADAWPYDGVLAHITLDCPGAEAINAAIDEAFTELADDPMWDVHYEVYKGAGRVLSVLMVQSGPNDVAYYPPYSLDLATGQALTGQELLDLLEVDAGELAELELTVMGEEFDRLNAGARDSMEDTKFYDGQRDATIDPDNADTERVWIGEGDQLYFAGRIYALAGAGYYEHALSTGLTF